MTMDRNDRTPPASRQPFCTYFEPLLALLGPHELDAAEELALREHVAGCAWCQARLIEYDDLDNALRRHYGADQEIEDRRISFEEITSASDDTLDETVDDVMSDHRPPMLFKARRPRTRLTAATALAAALLVAVLGGSLLRWQGGPAGATTVPGVGTLAQFPLPLADSQPGYIIAGHDGNLWFTEHGRIGRITPRGVVTEFALPANVNLNRLAAGSDGTIWFTDTGGTIGRLAPRDGKVTEFPLPTRGLIPDSIVAWDGNLWFLAEPGPEAPNQRSAELGRITPGGVVTEFPLAGISHIAGMAVGPDDNLWFTTWGTGSNILGRMRPSGALAWFQVPNLNGDPGAIIAGPDGNLWFVLDPGYVCRITPGGGITAFALSGSVADLAVGPDRNLWFVTQEDHLFGYLTPKGTLHEVLLPDSVISFSLTTGPDGNLWFTDTIANTIDRLELTNSNAA